MRLLFLVAGLLLLAAGCAVPHQVLDRPLTPVDAKPSELLPPGPIKPFVINHSLAGEIVHFPDGSRIMAARFPTASQALATLKAFNLRLKPRKDILNRNMRTKGTGGFLTYQGPRTYGLAWNSGVWLFISEAGSQERLDALLNTSKVGGQGRGEAEGFVMRHFLGIIIGSLLVCLLGTYWLMIAIARRMAVPPQEGVIPVSRQELMNRLLSLNDPKRPYAVAPDSKSDLVAEWKIVDASWWGIFYKAGLKKTYRMRLALDENRHEVRSIDEEGSIAWMGGAAGPTPTVKYQKTFFRGIVLSRYERAYAYGWKSMAPPEIGTIYNYRFELKEIKGPIVGTIITSGWRFFPVLWPWQVRRRADLG